MPPPLRALAVAAALALAGLAAWRFAAERGEREALIRTLSPALTEPRRTAAAHRVRSEPDPPAARALAARALLAETLSHLPARGSAERFRQLPRLDLARSLAARVLAEQPASWSGATALGAATYLAWSLARDGRLLTSPGAWEDPLTRATELGPGQREPARFLSMAYLEVWGVLGADKRRDVERLLAAGFEDPGTFNRLIEPWLTVAGDLDTALALVPPRPSAWDELRRLFAARRDWPAYRRVTAGWERVLRADVGARIDEGAARLAAGDPVAARALLLTAARQLPPDGRFADLFTRALRQLPAGPVGGEAAAVFAAWLDFALPLCVDGSCPLPPEVIGRLAGAAFDLDPPRAALAALAAGDLPRAERYERRADGLFQEAWAPYLVLKARRLTERGDFAQAMAALRPVSLSWTSRPIYWLAQLAAARGSGDGEAADLAVDRLAALRRSSWPSTVWQRGGGRAWVELLPAGPAPGLVVDLRGAPEDGAVVEVRWDGTAVGTFEVSPAAPLLRLTLPVDGDLHRLELTTLAGAGDAPPGRISLAAE